jgi:hypothetical protein
MTTTAAPRAKPISICCECVAPRGSHLRAAMGGAVGPCSDWSHAPPMSETASRGLADRPQCDDAWAVGYWRDAGRTRSLRCDGMVRPGERPPGPSHLGLAETAGVDAAPGGDVWVVGNVTTTRPTYNLPSCSMARREVDVIGTMTLRPQTVCPLARGGMFAEVDALAADDIWAWAVPPVRRRSTLRSRRPGTGPAGRCGGSPRANQHHGLSDVEAISLTMSGP